MKFKKASNVIFNKNPCINLRPRYLIYLYLFVACWNIFIPMILKFTKSNEEFKQYFHASKDVLFTINNHRFDWWSVSHFLLYTILGFAFPHLWCLLLLCSFSWELFEYIMSWVEKICCGINTYWYGRWSDLGVNTSGFIVGLTLRYIITMGVF